ncbi:MAG TPA: HEAT repeat domain-containing protein, partial [Gemmataceae bacterium]|nr:HEAT repeat domain-containing protein [Gemmataceae bacterium]
PILIKALADKNDSIRRKAAYTLGRIAPKPEKVVGELIKALGDKNEDVRQAAVEAVSKMGQPAVPALIEALENTDHVVRNHAAQALGEIGADAKAAIPGLKKLMLAEDAAEKGTLNLAADALGKIGKDAIGALNDALKDNRENVRVVSLAALGRVGAPAVPALVDALGDKRVDVRRMAAQVLMPMRISDKMVVLGLTFALKDQDDQVRNSSYNALQWLGVGAKPAAPHLQKFLSDPNFQTRNFAFHLLRNMGENPAEGMLKALAGKDETIKINTASVMLLNNVEAAAALPVLLEALSNKNATLRMQAAHALAQTRRETEKVLPILVEGLKNKDVSVRQQAVQALASMGNLAKEAAPALIDALRDQDINLRQQAVYALRNIQADPEIAVPALAKILKEDANNSVRIAAIQVLSQHGGRGLTHMLEALKDKDAGVRQQAIWALQNVGGDAATIVPVLAKLLKEDKNDNVRVAVVQGLWRHGAKAIPVLIGALKDSNTTVRQQAVWSLQNVQGGDSAEIVAALKKVMKDENAGVRSAAVQSLWRHGAKGLPLLIEALKDKDAGVRQQAVWTMQNVQGADLKDALPILKKLLKDDNNPNVRQGVIQIMARIGEPGIPLLIHALDDSQENVRWMAAMHLRNFGDKASKAIPKLTDLAVKDNNSNVRVHSMYTLVHMGDDGVTSLVRAVSGKKDANLKLTTIQAIGAFGNRTKAEAAIKFLADTLEDKDANNRTQAAYTLINIGRSDHPGLVKALKTADSNLRQNILQHMINRNYRSKDAVPRLIECLKDGQPQVRWLSAQILGNIGPDARAAIDALTAALDDGNQMVRDNARAALKQIRSKE